MAVIRQLKNFFTKQVIYPKTLTKAVYDENGERLDKILRDTMLATDNEEYSGVEPRDADTLGGKYKSTDIDTLLNRIKELESENEKLNSNLETKLNSSQLIVSDSQLSGNFVFDNEIGIQIFLLTLGENAHLIVVDTQKATSSFSQAGISVTNLTSGSKITGIYHIFGRPSGKYRLKVNTSVNTDVAMCLIPLRPNFKVSSMYTSAT